MVRLAERLANHPHRPSPGRHWSGVEHPHHPAKKSTVAWLVTLARAGYGVALVAVPGLLIGLTGQRPGRRACGVARVLGVRHLVQAGVTVAAQRSPYDTTMVVGGGALVDLLHAGSMVVLGAADVRARRAALNDAVVEMGFAAAGAWAARATH